MAARIKYLNGQLRKRKIGGISAYELPEDLGAGSILHLATLNENLAARVGYLEDVLNAR